MTNNRQPANQPPLQDKPGGRSLQSLAQALDKLVADETGARERSALEVDRTHDDLPALVDVADYC